MTTGDHQPAPEGPPDPGPPDPAEVLARIAGGRPTDLGAPEFGRRRATRTARDYRTLLAQLGVALTGSARRAGGTAVGSGRWLADVVVDAAPRIPIRDLDTLRRQHPGLDQEQLADVLVRSASRATALVGIGGGALTGLKWALPLTLVTIPIQLAVEIAAVAVIEIKLVAELHAVYGVDIPGTASQRGTAFALAWANRRGINPMDPATITAALGVVARRRVQRRLVARAGRSIGTLAPLMAGAVYGGYVNRRQTLILADSLRGDLRRHPLVTGLTGHAVSRLLQPALGRRARRRRRPPSRPSAPSAG